MKQGISCARGILFLVLLVCLAFGAIASENDSNSGQEPMLISYLDDDTSDNNTTSIEDPVACTMDWNPVCGVTYISKECECPTGAMCKCATEKVVQTYGNKCAAEAANATIIYYGECGVGDIPEVKEQVKCLFNDDKEKQKCYSFFKDTTFSCTTGENGNYESCIANVLAPKGTKLEWKSTCSGYASTIVDGESEYAKFDCQKTVTTTTSTTNACACTKEYAPVCGTIKVCQTECEKSSITSNDVSNCTEVCYEKQKTFGNTCTAKCAGVVAVFEGVCEQSCPIYAQPVCPNGTIENVYDDRGCAKPKCKEEQTDHFVGAYYKCLDGTEFKETGKCMPYAFWKEKAKNSCRRSKCGTTDSNNSTSGGQSSATGNFLLDIANSVTNTVMPAQTTENQTTTTKCLDEIVELKEFEVFGNCSPSDNSCKYYVNEEGCKIKECTDGQKEKVCPTTPIATNTYRKAYWQCQSGKEFYEGGESSCKTVDMWKQYSLDACKDECSETDGICSVDSNVCEANTTTCGVRDFKVSAPCFDGTSVFCSKQSDDDITNMKEKCYSKSGSILVELDSQGCRNYVCTTDSQVCNSINDLSAEKKITCEERGGQLVTKVDEKGCLTYVECIGEKIIDQNASINKELIKDKIQLLDLAVKIETAKIELEKTIVKIKEIAKFYEDAGKEADANRFYKAANILEAAVIKLEEIKQEIKNNVDNFGEDRATSIREIIRNIKEELLKEALLEMLG